MHLLVRGTGCCRWAHSSLAPLRPRTAPARSRILGSSVIRTPARKISSFRYRHRKWRDNLPMSLRPSPRVCVEGRSDRQWRAALLFGNGRQPIEIVEACFDYFFQTLLEIIE